jgi:hypothetical protein
MRVEILLVVTLKFADLWVVREPAASILGLTP